MSLVCSSGGSVCAVRGLSEARRKGMATSMQAADLLYSEDVQDRKQRFPGLEGSLLADAVFRAYAQPTMIHVPLFSAAGERLLFRHPLNNRSQQVPL